ncbi:enoyl-CoA hydratase/isomerase family protein [bacterium]|nr:enoyl-CoA hydratase/isomerase family protein [bacterium]
MAGSLVSVEKKGDISVVTLNNPPVNSLSFEMFSQIDQTMQQLISDASVKGIVVVGAGRNFSAGFDLSSVSKDVQPDFIATNMPKTHHMLDRMEDSPKPIVAAIAGNALGGGCELALGCHYRVADKTATLGLPEVKVGLLPGAGGTQRLPRLVGLMDGLQVIGQGKTLGAAKAHQLGLVDLLVEPGQVLEAAIQLAVEKSNQTSHPKAREKQDKLPPREMAEQMFAMARHMIESAPVKFRAPGRAVACIEAGALNGYAAGIAAEQKLFVDCYFDEEAQGLIHFFFASRSTGKIKDLEGTSPMKVGKVAVIGGGTMGRDIAFVHLLAGYPTHLLEVDQPRLDAAVATIKGHFDRRVEKNQLSPADAEKLFAQLTPTLDYPSLSDVDLVIEAVFERMDIKKDVFVKLAAACKPGCILASNTSTLPIGELARVTKDASKVIGLHFFSPARAMPLLEIIRFDATSKETIQTCLEVAKRIKKTPVLVRDCYGFLTNRIAFAYGAEANALLEEGASIEAIDQATVAFGFPMGPFTMGDMAGNDIAYHAIPGMMKAYPQRARKVSPLVEMMFKTGRHGQKAGKGFYAYDASKKAQPDPEMASMVETVRKDLGISARKDISAEEITERIVYTWVNIAADCLEDGTALSPDDVDVATVMGFGFPAWKGGAMNYARHVGFGKIVTSLDQYAAKYGKVYEPSAWLRRAAEKE